MILRDYKNHQWKKPKAFMIYGCGFVFWKWCGIYVPITYINVFRYSVFRYDCEHSGQSINIDVPRFFAVSFAVKGKLGWHHVQHKIRVRLFRKNYFYPKLKNK